MGLLTDPISAALNLGSTLIERVFPDPAAQAQAKLELLKLQQSGDLASMTAQTDIDKAEAQSTDPLQHWRGGLGWVCVAAYAWNFVVQPLVVMISTAIGRPLPLVQLDSGPLFTLTAGMLGLGGLDVTHRVLTK